MTRSSVFRAKRTTRRRRKSTPSTGAIATGFLGMLTKLSAGSERLAKARRKGAL